MGMDFVTGLPWTRNGHNTILTFVDRLSKMCHFAATTDTVGAEETASLYINNVFACMACNRQLFQTETLVSRLPFGKRQ